MIEIDTSRCHWGKKAMPTAEQIRQIREALKSQAERDRMLRARACKINGPLTGTYYDHPDCRVPMEDTETQAR